jgi:hypothetical protein
MPKLFGWCEMLRRLGAATKEVERTAYITALARAYRRRPLPRYSRSLVRALSFVRPRLQLSEDFSSATVTSVSRASALILLLLPEKSLLNLGEDLVEPLLGAISSLLVISYVGLQLHDPVFGSAEFLSELLSKFEGVLTVRLGYTRRLMQQTQDAAAGAIQFIALVWRCAFRSRGKLDHRL